jgi:ceramide glucosyltransferase
MIYILMFWILQILVVGSGIYHLLSIYAAADFFRPPRTNKPPHLVDNPEIGSNSSPSTQFSPPISILKPVRGVDAQAYECWVSFCRQDYPEYELLFGVRDAADPAVALIQQLQRDFPERRIGLTINPTMSGLNAKVSNLCNIYPQAQYDIIIVSDSDILVPPDYLQITVQPFAAASTGVVTSLYRGISQPTVASRLEAIGISGEFMLGVLVARWMEGVRFALGASVAIRRAVLGEIGGFAAIANQVSDDFLLGNLAAQVGYEVVICPVIVDTTLPAYQFKEFLAHQLRWARTTKFSRPSGYVGLLFTFTTIWASLLMAIFPESLLALSVGITALIARFAAAWIIGGQWMQDQTLQRYFYLLPLRDFFGFLVWVASFLGNTVSWRGDRFRLTAGGYLNPLK